MRISHQTSCEGRCTKTNSSICHQKEHGLQLDLEQSGLEKFVSDAIHLGSDQYDLAVEKNAVNQITEEFGNSTSYRLVYMVDPLFCARMGMSARKAALLALEDMKARYDQAMKKYYESKNPEEYVLNWYEAECTRFNNCILEYRSTSQ